MSSLTLLGDTSGSIVLDAPAVAGSSTITLPTTGGTIRTTKTPGTILQVVQGTLTGIVATSTATWGDTGLSATITPTFATSKILITVNHAGTRKVFNNTSTGHRILKNSSLLIVFESLGGYTGNTQEVGTGSTTVTYLDSPATTSALTYKTQINSQNAASSCRINDYNGDTVASYITLMEIAA
jgi:hypothetical protein